MAPDAGGVSGEYGGKTDASKSIITLLEQIQEDFASSITATEAAESEAQGEYDTFKSDTETDISDKGALKETAETDKTNAELDITQALPAVLLSQLLKSFQRSSWRDVATVPLSSDRPTRERVMRGRSFSRVPVVDRDGQVKGLLHVIDAMLTPEASTEQLIRDTIEIPSSASIFIALSR